MPDSSNGQTFYVTTPIYYPNDRLHIGHTYTTVAADVLARYNRLRGKKTWFLTGTDEHGLNIQRKAQAAGKTPIEYVNPIVDWIKSLWQKLHIEYDDFIRTTEERHVRRVQAIFQKLYDQGDIYKGIYRGLYCTSCEAYYTQDELKDDNLCPIHERPVEWLEEESYFFRLSKYQDALTAHIENNPEFVQPASRRNEVLGFIRQGLEDLSVSRTSFSWGIPVPFDSKHVIYVWIDALANYITALDYPDGERYRTFWPADIQIIGKDILRFHAVIWPAMLMALGVPLPKCVYGHGWLMIDGGKIGKSRAGGQTIDPLALIDRYGIDPVRYFLVREVPFGADGTYSEEALVRRLNTDLANDLGNLVWRTTGMIERFLGGVIPRPEVESDGVLRQTALDVRTQMEAALSRYDISSAVSKIWDLINRANKYIDEQAPWELNRRGDRARLVRVLYDVAESARFAAVLLTPFLVETPERIYHQLGFDENPRTTGWEAGLTWGRLPGGITVRRGEPLFPRIDLDAWLAEQEQAVEPPQTAAADAPAEPDLISIDDFKKLDLRVATVIAAEPIKGADRLLRLRVDLGSEQRQVVAGIAGHYQPDQLVGRQVVLVANLQPAVIRGVKSEGMILAAEDDGKLRLVGLDEPLAPGSKVR